MAYRNGYSRDDRNLDRDRDRDPRDDGKPPIHIIEHLATFSVSRNTGISFPVDGMRRLRQMEQTNGIWSQKMQICLDHPWVLILDESGVSTTIISLCRKILKVQKKEKKNTVSLKYDRKRIPNKMTSFIILLVIKLFSE